MQLNIQPKASPQLTLVGEAGRPNGVMGAKKQAAAVERPPPPAKVSAQSMAGQLWSVLAPRLRTVLFGAFSLAVTILLWDLATRYRLQLYVRFNNIPTPEAVYAEAV